MNDPRTCVYGRPRKFGAMGTLPSCTRPRGPCLCGLKPAMQGTVTGRISSHTPHFEELPRGNVPKSGLRINVDPDLPPGAYRVQLAETAQRSLDLDGLDLADLELRVLGTMCDDCRAAVLSGAGCPWDNWKPGRDVA